MASRALAEPLAGRDEELPCLIVKYNTFGCSVVDKLVSPRGCGSCVGCVADWKGPPLSMRSVCMIVRIVVVSVSACWLCA